jgi:hypothetical protein
MTFSLRTESLRTEVETIEMEQPSASEDRSPITADRTSPPSRTRLVRPLRVLRDEPGAEAPLDRHPEHRWHPIEGAQQRLDLGNRVVCREAGSGGSRHVHPPM